MARIVLNVIYDHPTDPQAFEAYYADTHMPIAERIPDVERLVLLKALPGADGAPAPWYRTAQIFFADAARMEAAMASPEAQAAVADLANFATGGVRVVVAEVV
ncbi:EthD family reductase [Novosphingobium profundi]|uniref:EthD family reductase n=1 Tax=Novosphingobium profundi TaxID=1774954 RepID=UPI001BD9D0CC|nr:EthD family reductase [Novosphingobium profundi]MBT0669857.1 EthD family reductase [Novosphingobium profundi]